MELGLAYAANNELEFAKAQYTQSRQV
jgi:hypothetical protein